MEQIWKIIGRIAGILTCLLGLLFVVYFWNIDKKLCTAVRTLLFRTFTDGEDETALSE
ncbi:MAG: hypothetical protein IKQ10_09010 [Oscillospiraceae bacterium]|nr:hypothetical protein [Oscillospiraceae bacterium]